MNLIALLLPLLALAAGDLRLPEPGTYTYANEFEVLQKRVTEAVRINTPKGRDRAEALRKEGYACTFAGNELARCVGFVSTDGAEDEIRGRVEKLMSNTVLIFGALEGSPSLAVEGESFQQWSVPQSGSFRGRSFAGYDYQLLSSGVHKLYFGTDGVVAEGNGFAYVTNTQRQLGRDILITYLISAKLR